MRSLKHQGIDLKNTRPEEFENRADRHSNLAGWHARFMLEKQCLASLRSVKNTRISPIVAINPWKHPLLTRLSQEGIRRQLCAFAAVYVFGCFQLTLRGLEGMGSRFQPSLEAAARNSD